LASTWAAWRIRRSPAVIGGLAVSSVLTLVLIPTLYVILEERFPGRIESPEGVLVAQGDAA
jgi:multidrug efflux pump subunit AcrB